MPDVSMTGPRYTTPQVLLYGVPPGLEQVAELSGNPQRSAVVVGQTATGGCEVVVELAGVPAEDT